jgi:type VI secretion system protein ImpF
MARIRAEQPLVPSLLDRLIDEAPQSSVETPRNRVQVLRELKLALRRDLEALLNSRRRNLVFPKGCSELERSVLTYGIPDFSGTTNAMLEDREAFCELLKTIILQHEPRLKRVSVELTGEENPLDRTLRFRIQGLLWADPAPEPVVFDTSLASQTGQFAINGIQE